MIKAAWKKTVSFLVSAPLAIGLLIFVAVWSFLATLVAQGPSAAPEVAAWAKADPALEPVVRTLGLHQAFTSWIFLAAVVLLGISTVVCSWRRTTVAVARARKLRAARAADKGELAIAHDVEIACAPDLSDDQVLSVVSETLAGLGIRAKRDGEMLRAVSSGWSVWGSPVFHWALVAMIAAVLVGQLVRSEGSILLAVGEGKPVTRTSYWQVASGPLHSWAGEHRSVRLENFEPDYKTGGIDRGAVPTVALLDGTGKVLVKQRIYQNKMLHDGFLSINAPGVGLAVALSLLDSSGSEAARAIQYLDFSQTATGGTIPVNTIGERDASGKIVMGVYALVPLEGTPGHYNEWIPRPPRVRIVVVSGDGATLVDRTVKPGDTVAFPGGGGVRVAGLDWYSRLSLVQDPTIPLIYTTMVVAMIGLTMTLVFRQILIVAAVVRGPEGAKVALDVRLWRNASTSRDEIQGMLSRALGGDEEGNIS